MPEKRSARPSRRQREREAHRRELVEAAERVFVREGYHGATVDQIAQEAEFAVGTLYNFFKGKDDLYAHVTERVARDFMGRFEDGVLSIADPEKAVAALIELRLTHFEDHRGFFRVFLEASPGSQMDPAGALPESCAGLYEQYMDAVTEIFRRGISQGVFDGLDPLYLTLCLDGIITAFTAYWSKREPAEPLAVRVEKMKGEFIGRLKRRGGEDGGGPSGLT